MSLTPFHCRPQEGVKIAATDEEAKAEAAAPAIVDIDVQANEILRFVWGVCFVSIRRSCDLFMVPSHPFSLFTQSV